MLDIINGQGQTFCDGVTRRDFIRVGFLGVVGLSLNDLFRIRAAQAEQGKHPRHKSVILIWMHGGPTHFETYDCKPDAPSEYRGPYKPIKTNVAGIEISEKLPLQATVMDKCTIIRSMTHDNGDHFAAAHWQLTGYLGATGVQQQPKSPSMGSITAYLKGGRNPDVPPYVNVNDGGFGFHGAAFLGPAYHPLRTGKDSYGNEGVQLPAANTDDFQMVQGVTPRRFTNRGNLLQEVDKLRREADKHPQITGLSETQQKAMGMILSGRTREAFDLSKEPAKLRGKYGPRWGEQALLARRLVEAGVTFVTLNTGYWDDHGDIKGAMETKLPIHDRMVWALVNDLSERGLLEDTLIVCAGEFGRTPKINADAGRDHWPQAQSLLIAGGGFKHGQVIGATNARGEYPTEKPIPPEDICALIYHHLEIDYHDTIIDPTINRPIPILQGGKVPEDLL
jgi:hypothetical protein